MKKEDLVAFAERDWSAGEASAAAARRERKERLGLDDAFRLADALRRHVQSLHPDWPTPEDRAADLEMHVRVGEMLRSVRVPRTR